MLKSKTAFIASMSSNEKKIYDIKLVILNYTLVQVTVRISKKAIRLMVSLTPIISCLTNYPLIGQELFTPGPWQEYGRNLSVQTTIGQMAYGVFFYCLINSPGVEQGRKKVVFLICF